MKTFFLLLVSLVLVSCVTAYEAESGESVGDAYMQAMAAGDAEALLAQVSDDVTLVIDGGALFHNELSGKEAMREYLAGITSAGFQLELTDSGVNGNRLTYPNRFALSDFQALGVAWVAGQDALIIENGKVVRDVWTIDPAAETALQEAMSWAMVMNWTQTVNDQDMEENLAMVADDIQRVVIGDPFFHEEINGKADFAAALAEQMALNMTVEYPDGPAGMQVKDNVVTTPVRFGLDPFRAVGVEWVYGTDEITFANGLISRHLFTLSEASWLSWAQRLQRWSRA